MMDESEVRNKVVEAGKQLQWALTFLNHEAPNETRVRDAIRNALVSLADENIEEVTIDRELKCDCTHGFVATHSMQDFDYENGLDGLFLWCEECDRACYDLYWFRRDVVGPQKDEDAKPEEST